MKNIFQQKVYYSDTDAYGVVWHGSYLRWLEMGRVELSEMMGLNLKKMADNDIVLPVVELNARYKSSAMLDDNIIVETVMSKIARTTLTFHQVIKNADTDKVNVIADVTIVAINNAGQLYKKLPDMLVNAYEKFYNNKVTAT